MSNLRRFVCSVIGADHTTRALRILTAVVIILIVGLIWSSTVVARESHETHKVAATNTVLGTKLSTDEVASCKRVNKVVDGFYSFVDQRAPSRKAADLVLASSSSTAVQRASAATTIRGLNGLLALFRKALVIDACPSPKENP